ncbi:MAG: twin-arginine translocase subunit TatB [Phycisphaerales bacterium]|nr:twin-arginine translocase subunit TatB [Hyphomonadaceae bacterium]
MLPSLGFQEILLLGVLALVVVGPKDLPLLLRKLGRWTAKLRGMAQEFRSGFDELARQAELDELKREVDALRRTTSLTEIGRELSKPLPSLESYAGVSPALPDRGPSGPPATPEAAVSASENARSEEPDPEQLADEAEQREPVKLDAPEHAEAAPIVRSAS